MERNIDSTNQKVQVILKIKIVAENQHKAAEIINFVIERVQVEKGCKNFQFYQDNTKKDSFLLFQEWESRVVFEKHLHSDEFRHVLTLIDLANELPEISFNTISQQEGLGLITSLKENAPRQE
jgi:quinol monooxygenase YgiN